MRNPVSASVNRTRASTGCRPLVKILVCYVLVPAEQAMTLNGRFVPVFLPHEPKPRMVGSVRMRSSEQIALVSSCELSPSIVLRPPQCIRIP